jgi:Skp family chaperone for outer membrane proteins
MNTRVGITIAIAALASTGCKAKPQAAAPTPSRPVAIRPIAVVDLDQVIKGMGWDGEIQHAMTVADRELRLKLNQRLLELVRQASDVRARVAKEAHLNEAQTLAIENAKTMDEFNALPLSFEQRETLLKSGIEVNLAMAEARRDYLQQLHKRGVDLVESYRKLITPTAERIAAMEKFRIVLSSNRSIVYYDPSTDVSQEVIDELNLARPSWERPAGM